MPKKVIIYGVTGFVGSGLAALLSEEGWLITGVSRKGGGDLEGVNDWITPEKVDLAGVDAVINLAGEPIDQRWNTSKKKAFHSSRIGVTEDIVSRIAKLEPSERPKVLINASAVGFYGDGGDELIDETSAKGEGYLSDLCADWESAASVVNAYGVREIRLRIGIVLGSGGQAFEKLKTVFKAGIGGQLGNGKQWMPWIHLEDLQRAIVFSLTEESLSGAVNGTAPHPECNKHFTKKMAQAVGRWVFFPVPGFVLKLVLGGFGGALLKGQKAIPKALLDVGFEFKYPKLEQALDDLV